jgi:hypothetical protein
MTPQAAAVTPRLTEYEMVVAPQRPLVHSYDPGKNPMELVPTPSGPMERWRADALLIGETSALTDLLKQVHSDAAEAIDDIEAREAKCASREEACAARERALGVTAAQVVNFIGRAAALFDKLQEARTDAERQQAEPIAHPPGSPVPGSDDAPAHTPGGELHVIQAKDPEQHGGAAADHIPAGGALHLKIPIPIPVDTDEAPELPHPPVTAQPISPGLDSEE